MVVNSVQKHISAPCRAHHQLRAQTQVYSDEGLEEKLSSSAAFSALLSERLILLGEKDHGNDGFVKIGAV